MISHTKRDRPHIGLPKSIITHTKHDQPHIGLDSCHDCACPPRDTEQSKAVVGYNTQRNKQTNPSHRITLCNAGSQAPLLVLPPGMLLPAVSAVMQLAWDAGSALASQPLSHSLATEALSSHQSDAATPAEEYSACSPALLDWAALLLKLLHIHSCSEVAALLLTDLNWQSFSSSADAVVCRQLHQSLTSDMM
jgi:hypothetical protein